MMQQVIYSSNFISVGHGLALFPAYPPTKDSIEDPGLEVDAFTFDRLLNSIINASLKYFIVL